jgi:tetratricopeptide (TPR) repeat protein
MNLQKPLSLQTVLNNRQQEMFVGREEEKSHFIRNLELSLDDDRRRFIYNIYGQGGVGKSTLLHHFQKLAESIGAITTCIDENQEDVPMVMGHIAKQFERKGHALKTFNDCYQTYLQRRRELAADPEAPQGLSNFIGTLAKTGIRIGRYTPAGVVLDFIDEDAISKDASNLVNYLARKLANKDEVYLLQKPIEVLTPLFLQELRKIAEKYFIALFFDTYERTSEYVDDWLRAMLEGQHGDIPLNTVIVIAGRDELDKNFWVMYERLLVSLPLKVFSTEEAREFLAREGISDERVTEVILRLSGRLPLLVATLATESPNDPEQVGDPSGTAVERFLKWEKDPKRRQMALDASLPRRLNHDILTELVGEKDSTAFFDWLKQKPFVEEHTDGWVYHNVVRSQMLHYKYRESPLSWATLHSQLSDYYQKLRENLELDEEQGKLDNTWQCHSLEILYHRICQTQYKQLSAIINGFIAAFDSQDAFARRWAETVKQAEEDAEIPEYRCWGKRLVEGMRDYDEDHYEVASEMFTIMLKTNYVEDRWRSVALGWCGYLDLLAGQYSQALVNLTDAIQLAPEIVKYWVNRGWIYFCMGCFEEAIADFTHAIEMVPEGGGVIFLRGFVHQRLKHYDEALADFTHAIELMPNIAEAIRRRGQVYWELKQYDEALEDFDRVIELMPDVAVAVGLRGQVHWELKHYNEALEDFTRAIELKPNDSWAIALRGQVYWDMNQFNEALKDFDSAIALDGTLTNSLSIDRALLLCKLSRYAEAIEIYNEGLNQNPNRYDLLYNFAVAIAHLKGIQEARIHIDKASDALLTVINADARATALYGLGGLEVLIGNNDQALNYLQQAILLDEEAKRWAHHDIVWTALYTNRRYQNLIS